MGSVAALVPPLPARPRIENWRVSSLGGTHPRLQGVIYGHTDPACIDGTTVFTSELIDIDEAAGVARTRNTTYALGTKAED